MGNLVNVYYVSYRKLVEMLLFMWFKYFSLQIKFLFVSTGMDFTGSHSLATWEIAVTTRTEGACCCT